MKTIARSRAIAAMRAAFAVAMIGSGAMLAACADDPPQTVSSTTEETTTTQQPAPPPVLPAPMPGAPGTVTTETTHSESVPQ